MILFSGFKERQEALESAKSRIRALVARHLESLARRRLQGIRIDPHGRVDASAWIRACQHFADTVVRPELTALEAQAVADAGLNAIANELIEEPVREECRRLEKSSDAGESFPRTQKRHTSAGGQARPGAGIVSGIIIRPEPLERILSGAKDWEMRSLRTTKRETIALIRKGEKAVYGVADIVDCIGPLSREEMIINRRHHGIEEHRLDDPEVSKWRFAWVLANVHRISSPVPCPIRSGAVTFVTLEPSTARLLMEWLRTGSS